MPKPQNSADKSPAADDSGDTHDAGRRAALRKLASGLGLIAGGSMLPERWTKPVIEWVVSPAQAQQGTPEIPPPPPPPTPPGGG